MRKKEAENFCPSFIKKILIVLFGILFSCNSFAALIAYGTAGFASRLAGASAFSATRYFFVAGGSDCLYHIKILLKLYLHNLL